jgi:hypothetical protein
VPLTVDLDRLRALLARGAESDDLDFKSTWDPAQKGEVIELAKDVAALESLASGGYIVIGANDNGQPSGKFEPTSLQDFDEQRIRSKIAAHLGEPIDLSASTHTLDGAHFVVIGVGPNRDGMRIMPKDGKYGDTTVWRASDVFVRRGTSSMRWNQHEARGIIERVVASRKEEWRRDVFETVRTVTPAFEPGGYVNVTVEMPADSFVATVTELIRRSDDVGVDLLLRKTLTAARAVIENGARPGADPSAAALELSDQLNRLDVIAALSSRYRKGDIFAGAMDGYRDIYASVDEDDQYYEHPRRFPLGHTELLLHLYALGAVLVLERRWSDLGALVRLAPVNTGNGYWRSLWRKAEVMTARAELLRDQEGSRIGVIEGAKPVAARLLDLIGENRSHDLTTLLVEVDVYRGIATAGKGEHDKLGAYTNFALYFSSRAERAFLTVLDDGTARAALFDGTDAELAAVYRNMNDVANREAFAYNGWDGFDNPRLITFAGTGNEG